jgi:hypothetical protein
MRQAQLKKMLLDTLEDLGGEATLLEICRYIWDNYEGFLRSSGDEFYKWQYDIRWAATSLRKKGILEEPQKGKKGKWKIKTN